MYIHTHTHTQVSTGDSTKGVFVMATARDHPVPTNLVRESTEHLTQTQESDSQRKLLKLASSLVAIPSRSLSRRLMWKVASPQTKTLKSMRESGKTISDMAMGC